MKTLDFMQATISHNLKEPHSKALEPDCLSPLACDYDTVSEGKEVPGHAFFVSFEFFGIMIL
jgi:hypothetical protein